MNQVHADIGFWRYAASARAAPLRCLARLPEQAFATVQGMTRLAETHDSTRIDALCAEALDLIRVRRSGDETHAIAIGAGQSACYAAV